jgi:cell division protein FtsI/penicillin-binding protein 2
MRTFSPVKASVVLVFICLAMTALLGRVAYLQTYGRQQTIRKADRQQHMIETLAARRGTIFDANGQILACTTQAQTVFVDPKFMREQIDEEGKTTLDQAITELSRLLDKDRAELAKVMADKSDYRFVPVAEKIDDNTCDAIRKLDIPGVGFQPVNVRNYPMGSLAAHVIGGVGKGSVGLEGLEMKYDKVLAGKDGFKRTLKDARRQGIAVSADDYLPPAHGQHLMLTIDSTIQMIAQQELDATCTEFSAKRGEVVVFNPRTGEVLALANYPSFNPQNLDDSPAETRRNRALTDPYEPGSTIKPFIVGPALAWKQTRPNEIWEVNSPFITHYGRRVTDVHSYGRLALWDVLVKSSNIGMCKLGERMGNPKLYQALKSFDFGKQSGIELPGEDPGLIHPLKVWSKYSTESVSQGYELMVTPLQIGRAFCAYANGGRLIKPRIIKGVLDADGNLVTRNKPIPLSDCPEVLDPAAAAEVRRILCDVVIRGTASKARSNTWNVFGKTGTAHISAGKAGYNDQKYTSSFVGGAPYEDPQLVVAFIVHEVQKNGKNYYGGTVSAPGAVRIFERSLAYLGVPPSPDLLPPPPQIADVLYNYNAKVYARSTTAASAKAE